MRRRSAGDAGYLWVGEVCWWWGMPNRVLGSARGGRVIEPEAQYRFEVGAVITSGPDLSVRCTRCHRWAVHIDRPITLAELNDRAQKHAEVCR